MVHDVGLAEEPAQDALVAALEQWPVAGIPDNPGAWLTTTAKRRAVDHIRRDRRLTRKQEQLARELERQRDPEQDDVLRLMLISCHPVLPTGARAALTLRLLGGPTTEKIARAFRVPRRPATAGLPDGRPGGRRLRDGLGRGGGQDLEPAPLGRAVLRLLGPPGRSRGRAGAACGEDRPPGAGAGPAQLDALCGRRPDLPLRERTLWRLLYESGAGVKAVLSLNVEDLDLADRRAPAGRTWVSWRSGTARLLPGLLADRTRGPVFLSDRRPGPGRTPAPADLCPDTGRRRLSYERAEYLFKEATRSLDPEAGGYTLGRLRHRAAERAPHMLSDRA
ncbi:sigma factor [Streptomyces sp. NPDC056400]|uniref:sigma factor n=1 Tax=Streptomyces sp. NPDC056400 TaxID=3345808 RepID=UPI0035D7631A